jgi:hypothetical protein
MNPLKLAYPVDGAPLRLGEEIRSTDDIHERSITNSKQRNKPLAKLEVDPVPL